MNPSNKILSIKEGLPILENDILSKHKNNYEGLFSEFKTVKHKSTKCCICNVEQGVVTSGLSNKGLRIFKTVDNTEVSYFICRSCLKNYNMVK